MGSGIWDLNAVSSAHLGLNEDSNNAFRLSSRETSTGGILVLLLILICAIKNLVTINNFLPMIFFSEIKSDSVPCRHLKSLKMVGQCLSLSRN